ncbi:MAG: methyltransferase domain-containing protein [Gammaproteobacteria bacterium]|nr:methyltransferase domain-containing protein [Gammaproteobacteria bacterium]NIR83740.1 methyltransferase domain-containing protein [Gammaproteobacteria bacterium]NIR92024.1 methyltransferase domain-containing protein [Gammaproteobacteria bacterium]NIU04908.1 methyltransferase domain-containing protein [Gammaproteobacteria bacterium]NIV51894.1 methyltransferase domain-containing protein [Gammaproteobacteria bacterium]
MSPDKLLDHHRAMLLDAVRTRAFQAAVDEVVRPGDTVLDLGAGTGVLAFFAVRAGARHVWAVDESEVLETAKTVAAANGCAGRITFIPSESFRVVLPERVDVVVSEMLGNLGIEESILDIFIDARTRFLKTGGVMIPQALDMMVAPFEAPGLHERFVSWARELYGVDFSPLRRFGANNVQRAKLGQESLLAAPACMGSIDLTRVTTPDFEATGTVTLSRGGTCHGLGVWFSSQLTAARVLTNGPPVETPHWNHGILPLDPPLSVARGDRLVIDLSEGGRGARWVWRARKEEAPEVLREHGTDVGSLADPETVSKAQPEHRPRLAERGEVVRYALELMDGERSVDAIADAISERYPSHFPVRWHLMDFVGRLSAKFAD